VAGGNSDVVIGDMFGSDGFAIHLEAAAGRSEVIRSSTVNSSTIAAPLALRAAFSILRNALEICGPARADFETEGRRRCRHPHLERSKTRRQRAKMAGATYVFVGPARESRFFPFSLSPTLSSSFQ